MASLNPNERKTKGNGWTDTPLLIYPNPVQAGFVADIITARAAAQDPRAMAGDSESISEMLNDEAVLKQKDRWRYVNPEDLVAIQDAVNSSFSPVDLYCLPMIYNKPDRLAMETSVSADIASLSIAEASRRLVLANRINELRKILELHYSHVHKIHFVYEDHAGYSLTDSKIHGGQVNIREYVGALTDVTQLSGSGIVKGKYYVDYTMPPTFREDRGFSAEMFTGIAIRNPNIATSKQVPRIYRVFPDFGAAWIQDLSGLNKDNIAANWAANFADAKPTRIKAEHINELRKAFSAYAVHTHDLVLQTLDLQPLEDDGAATTGTAFGINLVYSNLSTPRYLQDLVNCSSIDFATNALRAALGLEVPLMYDYFYNGKGDAKLANNIIIYNDFQVRNFSDENYPDYLTAPEGDPEDSTMINFIKEELMLLYHSFAVDQDIPLLNTPYTGTTIQKAIDGNGVADPLMSHIPLSVDPTTVYIQTPDILNKTGGPDYYKIGTAIQPIIDEAMPIYDLKELPGNKGYVKICFQPRNLSNLKFSIAPDSQERYLYTGNGYAHNKRRAYLVSIGRDDCVSTTPSPATIKEGPPLSFFDVKDEFYDRNRTIRSGSLETRLFCRTREADGTSKVYNSTGALVISNDITETLYTGGKTAVASYPTIHGDSYAYSYSAGASIFGALYGIDRRFSEAKDEEDNFIFPGGDEDESARGGDGRGILYQGAPLTDYYFRDLNFTVNTTERWDQKTVQKSRGDLIEIWLEYSDFALHTGINGDNLYSVHAAVTDKYGQIIIHLAGDVTILPTEFDTLCEVELRYDLNANKESWLSFGIQKPSYQEDIELNIISFQEFNDTIVLESVGTLTPDDMITVSGSSSNDGTFRVRKIKSPTSIEVDASEIGGITNETIFFSSSSGPAVVATGHKYTLTGETKIISKTKQSKSSSNDTRQGWEDFAYNNEQTCWALSHEKGNLNMGKRVRPNSAMTKKFTLGDTQTNNINQSFAIKMQSDPWFRTVPYKNPDSQLPSYFRSYLDNVYLHDGEEVDIKDSPATFEPDGAKAVAVLGAPICYLNLDSGNSSKYNGADHFATHPTILRYTWSDRNFGVADGGTKVKRPSLFDQATNRWSVALKTGDVPTNSANQVISEKQADIGDKIWVIFGNEYMPSPKSVEYTVLAAESILMESGFLGYKLTLDTTIQLPLTTWSQLLNDLHKDGNNVQPPMVGSHYGYYPEFIIFPKQETTFIGATYPTDTASMIFGLDFRFKSILIGIDPIGGGNHTTYGHQYLPVKNTKAVRKITSEAVSNTPTGNQDSSFNRRTTSPITQALALNETTVNSISSDIAGAILKAERGTTSFPNNGREIPSFFSNGTFQANGYAIKELKGAVRNPASGKLETPGDPIKAIDVNELYRAAEWLKSHNHEFEFEHTTVANVFVNITT